MASRQADGRAFVRGEDALEVRIRLQDRLDVIRRLERIVGVLDIDDCDLRILFLHAVQETVAAADTGRGGLIMDLSGDFSFAADGFSQLVGSSTGSVPRCRWCRWSRAGHDSTPESNATIGMPASAAFCKRRNLSLGIKGGKAEALRLLGDGGIQHVGLLVDFGFGVRCLERDGHAVGLGSRLRRQASRPARTGG